MPGKRKEVLQGSLVGTTRRALPGGLLQYPYLLYRVPMGGSWTRLLPVLAGWACDGLSVVGELA